MSRAEYYRDYKKRGQDSKAELAARRALEEDDERCSQRALDIEEGKRMRSLWMAEQRYQAKKKAFLEKAHGDE